MRRYSDVIHSILTDTSKCTLTSFEVTSTSMFPSLHHGDTVVVSRVAMKEVHRGDIVVAGAQGHYIVHRIIRKVRRGENSAILTKGDLSLFADRPFCKECLIGKAIEVVRNGRRIDLHSPLKRATSRLLIMAGFAQTALQSLIRPFDLRPSHSRQLRTHQS